MKHSEDIVNEIIGLKLKGLSSRKIAKKVFGKESSKSTVNDIINRNKPLVKDSFGQPKVVFLDVEVQGSLNISFPRFKAFISPQAVLEEPYLLTYAYNWSHEDSDNIYCKGLDDYAVFEDDCKNDILLVEDLWSVLEEADIVISHNASFDVGQINNRFAYHGISPPSPYKVICTLKALKKHFKLPSNSLDASTKYFELERKLSNEGIKLWVDCFNGDREAFAKMKEYNEGDIPTLRQLYYKVLPFIQNHPNMALYYDDSKMRCNSCGSENMKKTDKHAYTNLSKFELYMCYDCGTFKRTRKNVRDKDSMENTLMNVAG